MKQMHYDVVVCGGGVAGVAAAVASARQGAKTVLIEKQCLLGGLATSGLIYIYLPLCDGKMTQVTFGIAEEMLKRCVEYGPFAVPEQWGGPKGGNPGCREGALQNRYACCFSPAGFTLTLDKMLAEAGVDLWLDTLITGADVEGRRVTAVDVANMSGSLKITGNTFVDATGASLVTRFAGAKVISETNYVTPWILEMSEDPSYFHFTESLHVRVFGKHAPQYAMEPEYDGRKVTEFVRRAWQLMRDHYDAIPQEKRTLNYPVHLPVMPQIRKIAFIDAVRILDDDDAYKPVEHCIGMGADWIKETAPGWPVPYEALIPKTLDNLFAAGRCIGASGYAWEIFRVIPNAAMTGEAAGLAAFLCSHSGISSKELPFNKLEFLLPKCRK
ncbi:MAG: FAD-dependent oxidoreductase [Lentisphaeria bacterium]|nr:FAD-dependent oxidoreductase [Lentisphaeria bacterium]